MRSQESDVIKVLLENKEKELNIQSIAKLTKKDYKTVYTIIRRLETLALIDLKLFGRSCKITLKNIPHPFIFQAEYGRQKKILKNKSLAVMVDNFLKGLNSKFFVLLLFGSYARKTNTKNSDIDLFFIVPDSNFEELEKRIYDLASLIPLNLHLNIFKESDFLAMKNSKEVTVGSEAIKYNIILYGIEAYCELIR